MIHLGHAHFTKPVLVIVAALSLFLIAEPALAEITGPDVSSWQHPSGASIDWSAVKANGHPFAFVKATEDTTYTNPYFGADWNAIRTARMYRGAYHFARPASSAYDQAGYFASVVGNVLQAGDLPPVLDLEDSGGLTPTNLVAWTHTFLSRVQDLTGRTPMIYVSPNFWTNAMGDSHEFTGYPLWIARWTSAPDPNPLPGGWLTWTFWQYTDAGSIPGITGNVDVSRFNGDAAALTSIEGSRERGVYRNIGANRDGRLEAFAIGADHALSRNRQTVPSGAWSSWSSMGGVFGGQPVVGSNIDGRLEVYAVGTDKALYHAWEAAPNGSWTSLTAFDIQGAGQPAAAPNADGRQGIFLRGTDGTLWTRWQVSPNGSWSAWLAFGQTASDPMVALNNDGRQQLFVRRNDGSVWTRYQLSPNGDWNDWAPMGGTIPGSISVSANSDSRLQLYVRGMDNYEWTNWQLQPGGSSSWSGWQQFGGPVNGEPGVGLNLDGRQLIFVRGQDNAMWARWQLVVNGGWSSWTSFAGDFGASTQIQPSTASDANGVLQVLNLGNDTAMWREAETTPNGGGWTGWQSLGGSFISP